MTMKDKIEEKQKEIRDAKIELIAWLNDECPPCFPPLESYTMADLSHDFAEKLRERLDNIIILKDQLSELVALESESEEKELYEKVYIKSEADLPNAERTMYFVGVKDNLNPEDLYEWFNHKNPVMANNQTEYWLNTFD